MSNMLSSLKNASMAGRTVVEIPSSKLCEEVAKVLKEKGFLSEVKVFKPKESFMKKLHLELSKEGGLIKLSEVKRISKPGRRLYKSAKEIKNVTGGFGVMILSTPKGILSGSEARKKNVGGEVICEIF